MRTLVLNVATGTDLAHAEIPITPRELADLERYGVAGTAFQFLSAPGSAGAGPNLRAPSKGWHDVIQALVRRRKDDTAPQGAPIRTDVQHLTDRAMIIQIGRPDQIQRFDAGFIPDEEVVGLARGQLFRPLEGFPRRSGASRIKSSQLDHKTGCRASSWAPGMYETVEDPPLGPTAGIAFQAIANQAQTIYGIELAAHAPERVGIRAYEHVGWCPMCDGDKITVPTAKVTVVWNGWQMVREYEL